MTKQEQAKLNEAIERLEDIQSRAPDNTVYRSGRSDISMAYELLGVIGKLKAIAHVGKQTSETE